MVVGDGWWSEFWLVMGAREWMVSVDEVERRRYN